MLFSKSTKNFGMCTCQRRRAENTQRASCGPGPTLEHLHFIISLLSHGPSPVLDYINIFLSHASNLVLDTLIYMYFFLLSLECFVFRPFVTWSMSEIQDMPRGDKRICSLSVFVYGICGNRLKKKKKRKYDKLL